jgi:hypothetical protein
MFELPDDIAPYAQKFVRKGEPEKLIAAIQSLLPKPLSAKAPRQ